jgi:hypothetical protein
MFDADAQEELERRSELDRQTPEWQEWAARSRDEEVRRAEIPFPGLAPATDGSLGSAARLAALRSLPPARIGLVAAPRSADVLATVGWSCFDDYGDGLTNGVWIGAVLRSWENRFGARLLAIGPGATVLVGLIHSPAGGATPMSRLRR